MASRLGSVVLILVIGAMTVSCYRTYTGIYWIRGDRTLELEHVDRQIYFAIRDLGFERKRPGVYWNHPEEIPAGHPRLEGDQGFVSVAISGEPLTITLRDLSNRRETDFTREVKLRIERCLEIDYGLKDVEFKRQPEFVPN